MKRRTFRISPRRAALSGLLCLLFGLLTTTAIAWASGAWLRIPHKASDDTLPRLYWVMNDDLAFTVIEHGRPSIRFAKVYPFLVQDYRDWMNTQQGENKLLGGTRWWMPLLAEASARDVLPDDIDVIRRGWPFGAFECVVSYRGMPGRQADEREIIGGWEWPWVSPLYQFVHDSAIIPLRPVMLGLIADSVLFAALWLLILWLAARVWMIAGWRWICALMLVALPAGALSTIAVAWAFVVFGNGELVHSYGLDTPTVTGYRLQPLIGRSEWIGRTRVNVIWGPPDPSTEPFELSLPYWAMLDQANPAPTRRDYLDKHFDARGWPMLALRTSFESDFSSNVFCTNLAHGIRIKPFDKDLPRMYATDHIRILPLAPIWRGLLVDTGLYGFAWWLLLLGLITAVRSRRVLRRKRGACMKCGYDLRGALERGCPECGWNRTTDRD